MFFHAFCAEVVTGSTDHCKYILIVFMFDSWAQASKLKTLLFSAALNTVPFTQSTLSVGNGVIVLIVVVGVVDVVLSGKI